MDPELIWLFMEFNSPKGNLLKFKSLTDICAEKLVSDVCLLRSCTRMPRVIYCKLLQTAFDQSRILSISHLMRYSPVEELKLPVSATFECWRTLEEMRQSARKKFEQFEDNARTLLNTFFRLIDENWLTSQLQCVDLGFFIWQPSLVTPVHKFLENLKEENRLLFCKSYILKSAFVLNEFWSIKRLINSIENAKLTGFQLLITGLMITGNKFNEIDLLDLLSKIDPAEFVHFTVRFTSIIPSIEKTLEQLWRFKNLKHFYCCFMNYDFSVNRALLENFGKALAELPCITHLSFRSNVLSASMDTLLQHSCKKKNINAKKLKTERTHCCIVHDGLLEHLDISACGLRDEDISFLRELRSAAKLKHLNLGCNTFNQRAFGTLLTLNYSLIVLDIERCFRIEYNPDLFPFSSFRKLKFLNIKGWKLTPRSEKLLTAELEKIPNVLVFRDDVWIPEEDENF